MIERVYESIAHLYRLIGSTADGGRLVERDGAIASISAAAPERAVLNTVTYGSAAGLADAYDDIAAAYAGIGANWIVWLRPGDDEAARFLADRGHVLDAEPMGMAHDLTQVERPAEDALSDWTSEGDITDVGPLNDRAYGYTDSFTRALGGWTADSTHVYVARQGGEPVACLLMTDNDGNSDLELVAVVPEARGQGLSGKLLGHALADAAERGNETSTLVASRLGYPVYERAGYRPLEPIPMWQRAAG